MNRSGSIPASQLRSAVTQLTTDSDKSAIDYITSTDLLVDDSSAIASWLNRHPSYFDSVWFIWKAKCSTGAVDVEQQVAAIVWAICNKHDRFNY